MEGKHLVKRGGWLLGPALFLLMINMEPVGMEYKAWTVLAISAWMVVWWVTEAIPIAATALLPIVLFPTLGVMGMNDALGNYSNSVIFLFMGGFIIALALERHNLHKRIALNLIKFTGTGADGIILGFMMATSFLSMWISNTATAVMMLPIAASVVGILKEHEIERKGYNTPEFKKFALSLFLSIAYAANIGGMATIIGTPPNVVFVGYVKEFFGRDLEFGKWLLIGIPLWAVMIGFTYFLLTKVLFRSGLGKIEGAADIIDTHLKELGRFGKNEQRVLIIFTLTAIAWIFKSPINQLIGKDLLNDTITAMCGGLLMFIVPVDWKKGENLLDWKDMKRLPWGILILFGGGICLAKGMEDSGIIEGVGKAISETPEINGWVLILVLTAIMLFMTELMSNVALATIFIPLVFGIAQGSGIDPIVLAIPVTFASSCAFMLPISTPPNAIVFASGYITVKDMMRAGFLLNLFSILVLVVLAVTLVDWVY